MGIDQVKDQPIAAILKSQPAQTPPRDGDVGVGNGDGSDWSWILFYARGRGKSTRPSYAAQHGLQQFHAANHRRDRPQRYARICRYAIGRNRFRYNERLTASPPNCTGLTRPAVADCPKCCRLLGGSQMPREMDYRSDRGFSPRILSLLTDGFGRHGADVADLSAVFKQRARRLARDAEEARELARLCSAMQLLSDRIVTDALKAKVELAKLAPQSVTLSICPCGRTIEDGACPTRGHCSRGVVADITA